MNSIADCICMEVVKGACLMHTGHISGLDIFVDVVTDDGVGESLELVQENLRT